MEINKKITLHNFTSLSGKKNEFIVVHYVGAVSSAKNNADYYYKNRLSASAHYFVDEREIWQSVEDCHSAWHCGGGLQGADGHKYHGICKNSNSIGIEMCVKKTESGKWYFEEKTVSNTVKLIKYLMEKYSIPVSNVIRHFDVTGKLCPEPYISEAVWNDFKKRIIKKEVKEYTSANDIVWELADRGIVSDKEGMLKEMENHPGGRLYWLGRKAVQYIRENV